MTATPEVAEQAADAGPMASAMAYLTRQPGADRSKLGQRLAVATMGYHLGKSAVRWINAKRVETRYQIALHDTDSLYGPVQEWLLERMPSSAQKALVAKTDRRHENIGPGPLREVSRVLELFFDGSRAQDVRIAGHRIQVTVERDEGKLGGGQDESFSSSSAWRPARILFQARDLAGRDAVLGFLRDLTAELSRRGQQPTLYVLGRWGEWHATAMRPRPLDTVVLRESQLERLVADLEDFYRLEVRYDELGIPWHRGYLLHGPAGTGKTSTAKALAGHLGLDVYHVPLSDLQKDADLNRVVSNLAPRTMLLLEDVDVAHASRERTDEYGGVTAAGLLNALDGVVTPHGMVTVMTTNAHPSELDEALVRPGRADVVEELGYLTDEQFQRMVRRLVAAIFVDEDLPRIHPDRKLTPAAVVDVVKRHLDHPDLALAELYERYGPYVPGNGALR